MLDDIPDTQTEEEDNTGITAREEQNSTNTGVRQGDVRSMGIRRTKSLSDLQDLHGLRHDCNFPIDIMDRATAPVCLNQGSGTENNRHADGPESATCLRATAAAFQPGQALSLIHI